MRILKVLKKPGYLAIVIISIVLLIAIYIYSQVLGVVENIGFWLTIIPWYNAILFATFAVFIWYYAFLSDIYLETT